VSTFLPLSHRLNTITGEWIPLDPPVEIHHEDLGWLQRLWEKGRRPSGELIRRMHDEWERR
jgi:hypothetical protein